MTPEQQEAFEERAAMFRDIAGFPGYRVGDDGSVWTLWRRWQEGTWTQMKPVAQKGGYITCGLRRDGKMFTRFVHRLVLQAFVGPCPAGMQACHNDGDPANNHLSNLRWDTPKANQADRAGHGTLVRGEQVHNAVLDPELVQVIRRCHAFLKGTRQRAPWGAREQLSAEFGIPVTTIGHVLAGKTWKHVPTAT